MALTDTTFTINPTDRYSPVAVFADYSSMTSDQGANLWKYGIFYTDWDDPTSGTWAYGATPSASKNESWGHMARHLYEITPGGGDQTFSPTLYVWDGAVVTQIALGTITVRDPLTHFANKHAIHTGASPGDIPSGFTGHQDSDLDNAINTYAGANTIVLFRGGETFNGAASVAIGGDSCLIMGGDSFGFGTGHPIFDFGDTAMGNFHDIEVDEATPRTDITWASFQIDNWQRSANTAIFDIGDATAHSATDMLFYDINYPEGGGLMSATGSAGANFERQSFVECISGPATSSSHLFGFGSVGMTAAAWEAGCSHQSPSGNSHAVRHSQLVDMVIEHCKSVTVELGAAFKIHGRNAGVPTQDLNNVIFRENEIDVGGANNWSCNFTPETNTGDGNNQELKNVLIEDNLWRLNDTSTSGAQQCLRIQGDDFEVRNNVFIEEVVSALSAFIGVLIYNTTVNCTNVNIYGNTGYSGRTTGTGTLINIQNDASITGCNVHGNLMFVPSATADVLDDAGSRATSADNIQTSTNPDLASATPATKADFVRNATPDAQDGGQVPTGLYLDMQKLWRRRGANRTAGASEDGPASAPAGWPGTGWKKLWFKV